MPKPPPTEREMELLYLIYRARDYIEESYAGASIPVRKEIDDELMAVGDEEFWWDYYCTQHEKGKNR
jgi:hypothetical protein